MMSLLLHFQMFSHRSPLEPFSSVAIPCGAFHVGYREEDWDLPSTRARRSFTCTCVTCEIQRLGQQPRLSSLKQCGFCNALLGFCKTTVDDMFNSRVIGAAHSIYLTKRIRRPAEILKVTEVQQLEDICMQGHCGAPLVLLDSCGKVA